jgi:hypothetical protein
VEVSQIVAGIDAQIKALTEARNLLASMGRTAVKAGRGRPKGSKNAVSAPATKTVASKTAINKPALKAALIKTVAAAKAAATPVNGKRQLSPEGRRRIADAMKRRWAARRTEAGK